MLLNRLLPHPRTNISPDCHHLLSIVTLGLLPCSPRNHPLTPVAAPSLISMIFIPPYLTSCQLNTRAGNGVTYEVDTPSPSHCTTNVKGSHLVTAGASQNAVKRDGPISSGNQGSGRHIHCTVRNSGRSLINGAQRDT